eukprot:SAG31_NODE_2234_length_6128_cov_44.016752_6_plen_64_part_00
MVKREEVYERARYFLERIMPIAEKYNVQMVRQPLLVWKFVSSLTQRSNDVTDWTVVVSGLSSK